MAELGERYDVAVTTRISPRAAARRSHPARKAGATIAMIVMGCQRRPGEELFFGNTVDSGAEGLAARRC